MKLNDAQRKMIEDNHDLIYSFLWKKHLDVDEWYDIAALGLIKAVMCYDPNRGKLSTLAYMSMEQHVWIEMRKSNAAKRQAVLVSLDQPVADDVFVADFVEDPQSSVDANVWMSDELTEKQRRLLGLFAQGYNQCEVARMLRISQPHVSRMKIKIEEKLRR